MYRYVARRQLPLVPNPFLHFAARHELLKSKVVDKQCYGDAVLRSADAHVCRRVRRRWSVLWSKANEGRGTGGQTFGKNGYVATGIHFRLARCITHCQQSMHT